MWEPAYIIKLGILWLAVFYFFDVTLANMSEIMTKNMTKLTAHKCLRKYTSDSGKHNKQ